GCAWEVFGAPPQVSGPKSMGRTHQHLEKAIPRFVAAALAYVVLTIHGDGSIDAIGYWRTFAAPSQGGDRDGSGVARRTEVRDHQRPRWSETHLLTPAPPRVGHRAATNTSAAPCAAGRSMTTLWVSAAPAVAGYSPSSGAFPRSSASCPKRP